MSLPEALERAATALPEDADQIRPANGDPAQLLEHLDSQAAARVLTWLLTHEPDHGAQLALGFAETSAGAGPLGSVSEKELPKTGRKALRRALHTLRSRGIAAARETVAEPVVARLPDLEESFSRGYVCPLDPTGAQLVYLVEPNPAGGARLFEIVLDDTRGITQFEVYSAGRSRMRGFLKDIARREHFAAVEADPAAVRARVALVLRNQPEDRSLPRGFSEWRGLFGERAAQHPTPGAETLSEIGDEPTPERLRRIVEMIEKRELGPWPPAQDQISAVGKRLLEQAEGRVILSSSARRERLEAALDTAVSEIYISTFCEQTGTRFRESAFLLWKAGRAEDAGACLAAARALVEGGGAQSTVARALLEVSLHPTLESLRAADEEPDEASLLVKP